MSNHCGSYMLNGVLQILDEYDFFNTIGKDKTLSFIKKILKFSSDYDCNEGEILENIGEKLGICYYCVQFSDSIQVGLCLKCSDSD